MLMRESAVVCR